MATKKLKKPRIKERHRFLLKAISAGIRFGKTEKEIMKELGYSDTYSKSPNHLKETESWQALVQQNIPDALLAKVHKGLLTNKNWRARDAGLEKGYKLKKRYGDTTIIHKLGTFSDTELEDEAAGILSEALGLTDGDKKKKGK